MRSITGYFCALFLFVQMSQPFAQISPTVQIAQLGTSIDDSSIDLDPPQVDHIPVALGVAGASQSVSVKATDAQGVSSVTLLYRADPANEYKRVLMRQVSGTDNYTVSIESSNDQRLLEYYFLVIDTGGNKVLNGFPYEPFSRILSAPQTAIEDPAEKNDVQAQSKATENSPQATASTDVTGSSTSNKEQPSINKTNIAWVVLGVLALGALAAGSGGGGDATASGQTVPVILNVPLPD